MLRLLSAAALFDDGVCDDYCDRYHHRLACFFFFSRVPGGDLQHVEDATEGESEPLPSR